MAEIKIKSFTESPHGYADMYVSHNRMAFAFLSNKDEMIGPFVDCKGYINNRVHCSFNNMPGTTAYKWMPSYSPVDLEKTRLIIARKAVTPEDWEKELELVIDFVNQVEKDLHLTRSFMTPASGTDKKYGSVAVITGSKRWLLAPPMIDLYVWLIRNADKHVKGQSYLTTINKLGESAVAKAIELLVKSKYVNVFGKDMKQNWLPNTSQDVIHVVGILTFSHWFTTGTDYSNYITKNWPHWKLPKSANNKSVKEKVAA